MSKTPRKITTDDIIIDPNDYPFAYCKSATDDTRVYTLNYETWECDCNNFKYVQKDKGGICKHLTWLFRLMSMKGIPIPPKPERIKI